MVIEEGERRSIVRMPRTLERMGNGTLVNAVTHEDCGEGLIQSWVALLATGLRGSFAMNCRSKGAAMLRLLKPPHSTEFKGQTTKQEITLSQQ